MNDVLDEPFSVVITRMRLACVDELNRPLTIVRQPQDLFVFLEDQRGALVSGETAREPDCERVGIEQGPHGDHLSRIDSIHRPAFACAFARKRQELAFQEKMDIPDFFVRYFHHAIPE